MIKMVVYAVVLSIVYLVVMSVVNKKIESINFETNGVVETNQEASYLTVSIKGAVNNPGSYTASRGETLAYLIALAGGVSEDADNTTYNLSTVLVDKTTYYIGYINNEIEKISINEGTIAMLDTLPGIGSVLAKRIVSYRNSNGNFDSLEEITNVNGIGSSLFEQIKDLICL